MTAGSALGIAAVLAWSQVRTIGQLYVVFGVIGLAGAATLYEAAFPVLIAATEPGNRDRALLAVTIIAGFASSIFFPLIRRDHDRARHPRQGRSATGRGGTGYRPLPRLRRRRLPARRRRAVGRAVRTAVMFTRTSPAGHLGRTAPD
jgi:hypothetical protein